MQSPLGKSEVPSSSRMKPGRVSWTDVVELSKGVSRISPFVGVLGGAFWLK